MGCALDIHICININNLHYFTEILPEADLMTGIHHENTPI